MALSNPTISVQIEGKNQLKNYYLKESLVVGSSSEPKVEISASSFPATSGWCEISCAAIQIVNKIMVEAPTLSTLTNSLKITKADSSVIQLDGIAGLQILSFNDTQGSNISKVEIKTDSATAVIFEAKVFEA